MDSQTILLPLGNQEIQLSQPFSWHIAGILEPCASIAIDDPMEEAR